MGTLDRVWLQLVDALDSIGNWRPVRYFQVGAYTVLAAAASGPFVEPDVGALVGIGAAVASAAAYTVADRRRELNSPAARAERAAAATRAKLQAIDAEYAAENDRLKREQAADRSAKQAAVWEWEREALAADGGALEPPAQAHIVGPFGGHTGVDWPAPGGIVQAFGPGPGGFATQLAQQIVRQAVGPDNEVTVIRSMGGVGYLTPNEERQRAARRTGYGGAPLPPSRPTCWCARYGGFGDGNVHEHYWTAHEPDDQPR